MSTQGPVYPGSAKIVPRSGGTGARRRSRAGPSGPTLTPWWQIRGARALLAQIGAATPHA
eukprot:4256282-Pyramimonas_sp.AAC.1